MKKLFILLTLIFSVLSTSAQDIYLNINSGNYSVEIVNLSGEPLSVYDYNLGSSSPFNVTATDAFELSSMSPGTETLNGVEYTYTYAYT